MKGKILHNLVILMLLGSVVVSSLEGYPTLKTVYHAMMGVVFLVMVVRHSRRGDTGNQNEKTNKN